MKTKTLLFIFGTRPEAIKLAPLILEAKNNSFFKTLVCNTAQHREMTDEVLDFFEIIPDYDLDIMEPNQTLGGISAKIIHQLSEKIEHSQPDFVIVQGDTTTAFLGALTSYYSKIKIVHIEAGLRSLDLYSPHPEEGNRKLIGTIANYHFTPTPAASKNLIDENITKNVHMVGNTVIDALLLGQKRVVPKLIEEIELLLKPEGINILVTTHRRENFGKPLLNILKVLEDLTAKYKQLNIILPVHPNPNVKEIIHSKLAGNKQVKLISPLNYSRMIALMARVDFIMTDSGGIQEEAPTLGKPVIVLRNVTERAEGIEAGTAVIGGTEYIGIMEMADKLISDPTFYNQMAQAVNPYGDGTSSKQILEVLASA